MHMVTETYQLRDGEKLTEFYNGIAGESLFEFVRHYYSIGVEQMPTTCLKPNGRIEVNWPENLRDKCGLFGHTYREVYLQTFSSCCFHDITYDKDIVDKYLARPDFYRLNISLENDCNGTSSDAYLQLTFSLKHIGFSGGYNFASLFSAEYRKDTLLNPTYRKAIIKALQDKQEYYAEDEFDDAHIAERATDILDNLAEIFGSDEQED